MMETISTEGSQAPIYGEGNDIPIDPAVERRILWKLDLTILPLLTSVQFLSQMAKSDLGNAEVAGLSDEMNLNAKQYSDLAIMVLVGYIVFQIPGTMLIKKFGPSYQRRLTWLQFGSAVIAWGVFTTCLVAAKTAGALMALRFLVGSAEAFIQGTLIYLSFWYRYNELATRGAVFDGCSALAGAFNGIIGHQIQVNLEGKNGWRAWRWIFLIEGVIPIGWGFVVIALLPGTPETVRWIFSHKEKEIVIQRSRASHNTGSSKIKVKAVLEVLLHPLFWLLTLMNCCVHITTSSLSNFLPPILDGLGWKDEQAQLMSSIVYACAFVNIILCAQIADRTGRRGLLVVVNCAVSLVGFAMLLASTNASVRFAGTCLLTAALYPCLMLVVVWLAMNFPGYSYRTSCIALTNICAQAFSIIGNKIYVDPPYYREGLTVSACMAGVAGVTAAITLWWIGRLNAKKESGKFAAEYGALAEQSIDDLGNAHPDFRYTY
ncbi:uncharacterized protein N0V89_008031 [Didymosphaeria variabile]|uniref:Major facilitator superfamily (MFS) profile domain-containing protein n=1 Tax=Didymosphaeria variabile TaxID=1932322 RepID=A0A9W9C843_9PLEO|nr:uncharacterized protein N0V89_008031 [Didymosphaeria variabile]KAJ4349416.1 hypothetical protein N0V89_008031 [Didymosphaeria variabile]